VKEISENDFARALMHFVENSTDKLDPNGHESVADHWTYRAEGDAMSGGGLCLVSHGLFDRVYTRRVILPKSWGKFCSQYYSPVARLLIDLYDSCQTNNPLLCDLDSHPVRDDFPMTGHFWKKKHQNENFEFYFRKLTEKGFLTAPTRRYKNIPVVGLRFKDQVINIPSSYDGLCSVVYELTEKGRSTSERPCRDVPLYGESVPVLYMVGDTKEKETSDYGSGDQELYDLIERHTSSCPKHQNIVYVLADKTGDCCVPRRIGFMNVHILEIAYGSAVGAILFDWAYLVPNNLSPDEEESFDCSHENWKSHQESIVKNHPILLPVQE
jgi:hypothetical protein